MNRKILIATYPFAQTSPLPLVRLRDQGYTVINPAADKKMKLDQAELKRYLRAADGVIAGTEQYDAATLAGATNLKIISRVGIGLDNIDFTVTGKNGIAVASTPDAPSRAVAELTIGLMIAAARRVLPADLSVRANGWNRLVGKDISGATVGIIGLGRIGKLVTRLLQPFGVTILVNDLVTDRAFIRRYRLKLTDKRTIYRRADIISLHVPLTGRTRNLVNRKTLANMKNDAVLINTARGPVINETDLFRHLRSNPDFVAALDVFAEEPYRGPLVKLPNVILTPHLGSCSHQSRLQMELGAAENIISYFNKSDRSTA